MGKGPETTTQSTEYEYQPMPGSEWSLEQAQGYWNALLAGEGPQYPGAMVTPQESGAIDMYGGALQSLFGQGEGMGGGFGAAQGAIGNILDPSFLDLMQDPNFMAAMEQQQAKTRHRMGGAGLQYGTSLNDALMRGGADLFLQESGRRQNLQAGLGQFMTQFPFQATQGFMGMAGLPFQRNYGEWLRQVQQQQQGGQAMMGMGMGGMGQPMPTEQTTETPGDTFWDFFGDVAPLLMGMGLGGGAGAGFTGDWGAGSQVLGDMWDQTWWGAK